tara:strand:+ start:553 stop:759 length:207 start_codon:yes stop_codon:yes gene_type:complete
MSDKEWIAQTTWDNKEIIFVREHTCYDLESSSLKDMAERRIRQCEVEMKHWEDLLKRREEMLKSKSKD